MTPLLFFSFPVSLEQDAESPDAESVKLRFSLIATLILQKLKTELKNL